MPLLVCEEIGCVGSAVRGKACLLCRRRLCSEHLKPQVHRCPDWQNNNEIDAWEVASEHATRDEISALAAAIDIQALERQASLLRGGVSCSVTPLKYDPETIHKVMGGMNYHIIIRFLDGIEWICRIRRNNASSPPQEVQNAILLSEVATLRFLTSTEVPAPKVHGYATFGDGNPVGMGYILMNKLQGRPLDLHEATPEQKRRFMSQFADIFAELSAHPFPTIGCLLSSASGNVSVGPIVTETTIRTAGNQVIFAGPFSSARFYRLHVLELVLELIRQEEIYIDRPLDAYLVHRALLDNLSSLVGADTNCGPGFYLKHMDDKGDHILVDTEFNIVGIIDWECAQTVPKSEAFASPLFMLDVSEYYSGNNSLSDTEELFIETLQQKQYLELAALVSFGRVQHRIMHCVNGALDDPEFPNVFMTLLRLLLGESNMVMDSWDSWRADSLARYCEDPDVHALFLEPGPAN
ncbi:uncharacterized protein PHACADRAFT_118269 [Phanerochaete carnosa HHB-10118-sp]|uniref:Aminoglycoside phosphotransferase domain-containing protein n=1 Tax=Phanerochaete carnosa (strain HHB-10118-sp) TaxID=650164 RepID=K5WBZ2_PHACS|nr:uncharacterized protein PHACADRAFT_118269 [Phanerochaete carnosa HHB-10118-sp]EKM56504.1 hypothetical protein PHACADRAFT_118269 [Phanerochaete carnosa HHB-10118-sp]